MMKRFLVLPNPALGVLSWWGVKLFIYPALTLPPTEVLIKMLGIITLAAVGGGGIGFTIGRLLR